MGLSVMADSVCCYIIVTTGVQFQINLCACHMWHLIGFFCFVLILAIVVNPYSHIKK